MPDRRFTPSFARRYGFQFIVQNNSTALPTFSLSRGDHRISAIASSRRLGEVTGQLPDLAAKTYLESVVQTVDSQLEQAFRRAIHSALGIDADPLVSVSQNQTFGDYQSNAAMTLAKRVAEQTGQKTNPRTLAEQIKARLDLGEVAQEISIAGPGFINVRLSPKWLAAQLRQMAADGRLGIDPIPRPQTVVVDYSGPNIAKQMHVGHLRSTIIGDAISRVLEFQGHRVIRQNHVGDWGTQFGMVILGIWHLIMSWHRGDADYVARMGARLEAAKDAKDVEARKQVIEEVYRRHQADLDADPLGERVFVPAMKTFVPQLESLEAAYKFVNAVEDAPESNSLVLTRHTAAGPHQVRLSRVSNDVVAMLQAGGPENEQEVRIWEKVRAASLDEAQRIYRRLDVRLAPDDVRGESWYRDRLAQTVQELQRAAHGGSGLPSDAPRILVEASQGAVVVFHSAPSGQPLFLNKEGGRLPFLIQKSDGAYLYSTTDLAALRFRVRELHAERLIYVTDARQALHFEMLFATARGADWTRAAESAQEANLEHVMFGSITGEDGKPIKTREGGSVKLASLLDEAVARATEVVRAKRPDFSEEQLARVANAVGIGAVKYADLSKDRVSDYVFSWQKMLALDGNTAPYLQYAHARVKSIFRKAGGKAPPSASILLQTPFELAIAKDLMRFGEVLGTVARDLKPHPLCNYLHGLATDFSGFFENCPVIQSDEPIRSSRLLLCDLTARTLELGLDLLGIEHPDEM